MEICDNNITDLNGIQLLKNLRTLVLHKNSIGKTDHIDGLVNLSYLDISFNKLRSIERGNIGILPSLKSLICDGNYLKNVNAFAKLQGINFISLENNKIKDIQDIEKLALLEYLSDLNIYNNPICKNPGFRQNVIKKFVNLVKLDNVEISKEERDDAYLDQINQSGVLNNNNINITQDQLFSSLNSVNITKTDLRKVK